MTDIDAIRKRDAECSVKPYSDSYTSEAEQTRIDRRALCLAFDAKCEELANACALSATLSAELDTALTRISQLESRLQADIQHFRPLELGALSEFEQKYDALQAERDAAVRERDGLQTLAVTALEWLRETEPCSADDVDAWSAQLAALAPPTEQQTEQPKVML